MYFKMEDNKGEAMRLIKQAVFSDEKLKEYLAEAKRKTFELIDKGFYLHGYEVYVHPKGTGKPYLNKYKVSFAEAEI